MTPFLLKTGRAFYALAMIVYGIQQFIFGSFHNVMFPPWQSSLPLLPVWAYLFGIYLVGSGVFILLNKNVKKVSLILGGVFLFIFLFLHIPYELISQPNEIYHLGLWISALKQFALAGGALVIAGTIADNETDRSNSFVIKMLNVIVPYGSLFFCFTMTSFGISHFMYADFVATLVPAWMPDRMFWTYLAAVALIGSGICIALNIRMRIVALFLSVMIFIWFWTLHLPLAFNDLMADRGNNLSSSFDALAFSGIALTIAFGLKKQKWVEDVESI